MAKSQKIRIRLKAYDHKALDQSASKIVAVSYTHLTLPTILRV